jgi:hypothetical protein
MEMFKEDMSANVEKEQIHQFIDGGWFKTEKEALDAVKPEVKKVVDEPVVDEPVVDEPTTKIVKKVIKKAGK